jgi:beta-lactamase regulating signal transducer with metallopeptidase domain
MSLLTIIADLTIRGAIVAAFLLALDFVAGRWFSASQRRLGWLLVPAAFLLPVWWKLPVLPASVNVMPVQTFPPWTPHFPETGAVVVATYAVVEPLLLVWACGALIGAGIVALRTFRAARAWDDSRFSTDPELLELLEDCRSLASVRAPVGVVVSERIESPALLGWLRPKLLLPARWMQTCPPAQLRDVLLHELAHLRAADLAWGWFFTAMRVVHWFNPMAHLAAARWRAAREDAADEFVLRLRPATGGSYDETLLAFLKVARNSQPFGALGISENFLNLKHRIQMIQTHPRRVMPQLVAGLLFVVLATVVFLRPTQAQASEDDSKSAAVTAITAWLKVIDDGAYAQSWTDASAFFRKARRSSRSARRSATARSASWSRYSCKTKCHSLAAKRSRANSPSRNSRPPSRVFSRRSRQFPSSARRTASGVPRDITSSRRCSRRAGVPDSALRRDFGRRGELIDFSELMPHVGDDRGDVFVRERVLGGHDAIHFLAILVFEHSLTPMQDLGDHFAGRIFDDGGVGQRGCGRAAVAVEVAGGAELFVNSAALGQHVLGKGLRGDHGRRRGRRRRRRRGW